MQQVQTLRDLYQKHTLSEIEAVMGIPQRLLKGVANRYNITCGRNAQFKTGHHSWNTGKKNQKRMSPATEFKKGQTPHNTLQDGAVRLRTKHNGEKYYFIRIALGKWKLYQRHVWEKVHGPIPQDMIIRFRDGNTLNCDINNLELISRGEHARRNHNKIKAGESLKKHYKTQRLRLKYGMPATSGHGNRLKNIY